MRSRYHILVIDDSPPLCDLVAAILAPYYHVRTECDPHAGIEHLERHHFDALILDLHMPRLDGYEAVPLIRALPAGLHLPILLISASPSLRDAADTLDVQAVLPKPFYADRLLKAVEALLPAPVASQA